MRRQAIFFLVNILLIVGLGIYSYVAEREPNRFILVIPLALIVIISLLFLYLIVDAETRLYRVLDRKLPTVEYLTKYDVEKDLEILAKRAEGFIVATGGASHNAPYLKAIEQRVKSGVPYWRVLFSEPITAEMCDHLSSLVCAENVSITKLEKSAYISILAVDHGYIIALPVPGRGQLMGLKIPSADRSQEIFKYLMVLTQNATKVSTKDEIEALRAK